MELLSSHVLVFPCACSFFLYMVLLSCLLLAAFGGICLCLLRFGLARLLFFVSLFLRVLLLVVVPFLSLCFHVCACVF